MASKQGPYSDKFRTRMVRLKKELPAAAMRQLQAKIGGQALRGVVLKTPVGNPDLWHPPVRPPGYVGGTARANWQVAIDRSPGGTLETQDQSGGETINRGFGTIANAKAFVRIHLTNNVPYILRLENGWSKQAPNGMLTLTMNEIAAQFR